MDEQAAMRALEAAGTPQNRAVYMRHGTPEPLFGVSFAALRQLRKTAGTDHKLARALWASGNADARLLATMVADSKTIALKELQQWARDLNCYVVTDSFVSHVLVGSRYAHRLVETFTKSRGEWTSRAGWKLLAHLAMKAPSEGGLTDDVLGSYLLRIEAGIHKAHNRTRDAMNGALIAIGIRSPSLKDKALVSAARIGTVAVDHGDTGCKTPDAAAYILKTLARRRAQAQKAAKKAAQKTTRKAAKKTTRKAAKKTARQTPGKATGKSAGKTTGKTGNKTAGAAVIKSSAGAAGNDTHAQSPQALRAPGKSALAKPMAKATGKVPSRPERPDANDQPDATASSPRRKSGDNSLSIATGRKPSKTATTPQHMRKSNRAVS